MAKGIDEIKQHQFFNDMDWTKVMQRKVAPPFEPKPMRVSELEGKATPMSVIKEKHSSKDKQAGTTDYDDAIFADY